MKKMYLLKSVIFVGILLLSGCRTVPRDDREEWEKIPRNSYKNEGNYVVYNNYEVQIISEPSGAKVEINNDLVGVTPYTYVLTAQLGILSGETIFKVYPVSAGQYVQYKVVSHRSIFPRNMYFDLRLAPAK